MNKKSIKKTKVLRTKGNAQMVFSSKNYILFGVSILLIAIGFGGMYIENNFTGWFSLFVSPVFAVAGFILVAFAILYRDPEITKQDS